MSKKRQNHKKPFTIPIAVVGGFAPLAYDVGLGIQRGNWKDAVWVLEHNLLGINNWTNKWDTAGFAHGLYPILVGFGVHKIANMLGINRALAAAKIPIIRL